MPIGSTLPPQAYTREILTAAFNWLQTQPESLRKLAATPDALVGLYMRAQRFGQQSAEADAPISSQHFVSDLRNLAEGLKQFEGPKETARESAQRAPLQQGRAPAAASAYSVKPQQQKPVAQQQPVIAQTQVAPQPQQQQHPAQAHQENYDIPVNFQMMHVTPPNTQQMPGNSDLQAAMEYHQAQQAGLAAQALFESHWTPRTQTMIREVKDQLNLSSDAEAINLLVSIAYKNIKNLIG